MLHTLTKSPSAADLTTLCSLLDAQDDLVLLQDGVLCALRNAPALAALSRAARVHVLLPDVEARGLAAHIAPGVGLLDYTQFVALSVKHPQQMAW